MLLHVLLLAAGLTSPQCDALKSATLPRTTIVAATLVPAGPYSGGRGQPPMTTRAGSASRALPNCGGSFAHA